MNWSATAVGLCLLLALLSYGAYRHYSSMKLDARAAMAQIEEQMHRRRALLQKLVDAPDVPEDSAEASVKAKAARERRIRESLAKSLDRLHHMEKGLLDDLERTHMKIDFAARYYNDVVSRFNRRWSKLPGIKPAEPFDIEDDA